MTNKYLEKIAAFTGIELAATGLLGAHAANKGDGTGGAVAGIVGGALGHGLGTHVGPKAGLKVMMADQRLRKFRGVPLNFTSTLKKGLAVNTAVRAAATVGGAYLGGKAHSKFKHRNDY